MRFRREAHHRKLNDNEADALLFLAERYQLPLPERLLNDLDFLMTHAERMHVRIRRNSKENPTAESYMHHIYEAVRKLQAAHNDSVVGYTSSREFGTGMAVRLRIEKGLVAQSIITANTDSAFGVKIPRDRQGHQIRLRKGSKIYLQAIGDEGRLYQFASTVVGYNTVRGIATMFLNHSNSLRMVSKRKAPRRYYDKPAYYYPIIIEQLAIPGKKEPQKRPGYWTTAATSARSRMFRLAAAVSAAVRH